MWALVINPISGGGKGALLGREVAGYFSSRKIDYQVITATTGARLESNLRDFLNSSGEECQGVIAVGGDGLAHLVLQQVVVKNIPFTVVAAGTGNDLVRALGWYAKSIEEQLDFVVNNPPGVIDLGLVDSEWFGAILSTGFDSVVNERANRMKRPRGPMKYNMAIAAELPKFRPMQYDIELDNTSIQSEAMLIAVANGSSYGGGMLVCPEAKLDDGLFDVMVLRPVSKLEFLKVFPKVFKGAHIDHPHVDIYRSRRVSLSAPAIAYADGERIGTLPVQAECIAGAGLSWTP
jgi:diacylglycerol kinase (ATP)